MFHQLQLNCASALLRSLSLFKKAWTKSTLPLQLLRIALWRADLVFIIAGLGSCTRVDVGSSFTFALSRRSCEQYTRHYV
jgi:hypothetical protein